MEPSHYGRGYVNMSPYHPYTMPIWLVLNFQHLYSMRVYGLARILLHYLQTPTKGDTMTMIRHGNGLVTIRSSNHWEVSRFVNAHVKKMSKDMLQLDARLQEQRVTKKVVVNG